MPFPVVPEAVVRWGNGLVWKQFARVVQPVMDKRGLQWIQHKGALGDSVWMPLPTNDTEPETQVLLQTARVVAHTRGLLRQVGDSKGCPKGRF